MRTCTVQRAGAQRTSPASGGGGRRASARPGRPLRCLPGCCRSRRRQPAPARGGWRRGRRARLKAGAAAAAPQVPLPAGRPGGRVLQHAGAADVRQPVQRPRRVLLRLLPLLRRLVRPRLRAQEGGAAGGGGWVAWWQGEGGWLHQEGRQPQPQPPPPQQQQQLPQCRRRPRRAAAGAFRTCRMARLYPHPCASSAAPHAAAHSSIRPAPGAGRHQRSAAAPLCPARAQATRSRASPTSGTRWSSRRARCRRRPPAPRASAPSSTCTTCRRCFTATCSRWGPLFHSHMQQVGAAGPAQARAWRAAPFPVWATAAPEKPTRRPEPAGPAPPRAQYRNDKYQCAWRLYHEGNHSASTSWSYSVEPYVHEIMLQSPHR
jgi:hypothetical protein